MLFSPVRLQVNAVITRSDGTKEEISAIDLFQEVTISENDNGTTDGSS